MNKEIRLLFIFSIFVLTTTCQKDHMLDCIKSTGKEISEFREAKQFSDIDLKDNVDLIIRTDTVFYIKVTAGEHLIEGIITELDGNTLYIRNENKCNWMRSFKNKYTVEVGMTQPRNIAYYGAGDITCPDTIRTDGFRFDSWNGSGDITFKINSPTANLINNVGRISMHASGWVGVSTVYFNDAGVFDGSNLESGYTYIGNSSSGDCHIWVTKELGSSISNVGNIYYSGNPYKIEKTITGSGQLIHE